jgi:hypothetical protein
MRSGMHGQSPQNRLKTDPKSVRLHAVQGRTSDRFNDPAKTQPDRRPRIPSIINNVKKPGRRLYTSAQFRREDARGTRFAPQTISCWKPRPTAFVAEKGL